jgi:hypothetical protein
MRKVIHHLRKQPEEMRTHILHFTVIVAGIVLVFFWLLSLGPSFSNTPIQAEFSDELKPFAALKDNLVDGYKNISASVADGLE